MSTPATITHRGTIFTHPRSDPYARDADRNFNHAPSVVRMPDGSLLTVWFSGPWEGHHWQVLLASASFDGGDTWTSARVLQDTHGSPDFDPAFIQAGQRVWLFFAYAPHFAKLFGERLGRLGTWARYSDDSGRTWSEPVQVCAPEGPRSNGIVLSNGDYVLGVTGSEDGAPFATAAPPLMACAIKSSDKGRTWRQCGRIAAVGDWEEPTIVELRDGSLLMYLRNGSGRILQSRSGDRGETWSAAEPTDIVANRSSHCLYRVRDGSIALAYNPCVPHLRSPLVVRFSTDEARSWSDPIVLDEMVLPEGVPGHCAVTYPSIAENAHGELVVVWARYWITEKKHCGDIYFAQLRRAQA